MSACLETYSQTTRAWVVFTGQTDLPWLRLLKKGFRHCYLVLNDQTNWITIDPLSNMMMVQTAHVPGNFDLPLWLSDRGNIVIPARITTQTRQAPWSIFTCVETAKRVLGIRKRLILTPWQLYKFLKNHTNKGESLWAV